MSTRVRSHRHATSSRRRSFTVSRRFDLLVDGSTSRCDGLPGSDRRDYRVFGTSVLPARYRDGLSVPVRQTQGGDVVQFGLVPSGPVGYPSKLLNYVVMEPVPPTGPQFLYVESTSNVARQFTSLPTPGRKNTDIPPNLRTYDYRFDWDMSVPNTVVACAELLKQVLTMGRLQHTTTALALDWYKNPPTEQEPFWSNTAAGELVYRAKYWSEGQDARNARSDISTKMKAVIELHPTLAAIPTVVTVPGSKADFNSFGERLARHIASVTAKEVVQTLTRSGAREPRKGGGEVALTGEFVMPNSLSGPVLIIDDVFMSGTSMDATALAARQAGATDVYGLAIAKTRSGG